MENNITFNGACYPNDILEIAIIEDSTIFIAIYDNDTEKLNSIRLGEVDTKELFNFVTGTKISNKLSKISFEGVFFKNDVLIVEGGKSSMYFEIIDAGSGVSNSIALTCEDISKLIEFFIRRN